MSGNSEADENNRESGARVPKRGENRRPDPIHTGDKGDEPKRPYGLTEPVQDRGQSTRHYDGVQPPSNLQPSSVDEDGQPISEKRSTPSPDPQKTSGAGPAIAEHSKDAKAPKSGRNPGAYVKKGV